MRKSFGSLIVLATVVVMGALAFGQITASPDATSTISKPRSVDETLNCTLDSSTKPVLLDLDGAGSTFKADLRNCGGLDWYFVFSGKTAMGATACTFGPEDLTGATFRSVKHPGDRGYDVRIDEQFRSYVYRLTVGLRNNKLRVVNYDHSYWKDPRLSCK